MNNIHNIQSLQTGTITCNPSSASVGQTVTLSAVVTGGMAPYTLNFCHLVNNACSLIRDVTGIGEGQVVTATYTLQSGEIGTQNFRASIADSATPIHIFGTNTCSVTVTATPPPPTSGCVNCDPATNYCIPIINIILSHQIPVLRQLGDSKSISLENIEGIDLQSLNVSREKRLM